MSAKDPVASELGARDPGAGWRRRFAPRILLLVASLGSCLLVIEGALRVAAPESPPGTTYGRSVSLNQEGLRDSEILVPKPAGTRRVVILGDSFVWGVGLDVKDSLPKVLERLLAAHPAGAGGEVEVINAASPGHNTVQEYLLLRDVGMGYDPDMVVLVYNLNDIEYLPELATNAYPGRGATPVVEIDPGEDITRFSRNKGLRGALLAVERRSVLARFLVPRIGVVLRRAGVLESAEVSWVAKIFQGFTDDNPGWLESKGAIAAIASLTREREIPFLVAVYPLLNELDDYQGHAAHRAVESACRSQSVPVVDLYPLFAGKRARSLWVNFLDAHPNREAHRMVARALAPEVAQLLSRSVEGMPGG